MKPKVKPKCYCHTCGRERGFDAERRCLKCRKLMWELCKGDAVGRENLNVPYERLCQVTRAAEEEAASREAEF